jgi:hypothetical protein
MAQGRGIRFLQLIVATVIASVMTVFAVLGMVHLIEVVASRSIQSPIAVSRARLDFGKIPLHGTVALDLIVRNDGGGPLHARFLVRDATYRVEPAELILEPGIEWRITVEASPARPGQVNDLLRIEVVGDEGAAVVIPLAAEADGTEGQRELGEEQYRV